MKVKELIANLQNINPEADVLVQLISSWDKGYLLEVETDPASTKELTSVVKLLVDLDELLTVAPPR